MAVIVLEYGSSGRWEMNLPGAQLLHSHTGPDPIPDSASAVKEGVRQPIEFPPLEQAMVPGDRVVIVLDRGVPSSAEVIAGIWPAFASAGIHPEDVLILQPASVAESRNEDPRRLLGPDVRERITWKIHDPTLADGTGYLASSAAGERLYLAREVLDADFVLPIGRLGYDSMLGRRELTSAFYPGLSTTDAFTKAIGQGHQELGPDDERPLRQLVNEIAWLLGIQFAIQVLPSTSPDGMAAVLMGSTDRVAAQGRELLDKNWRVTLSERGETAIVAIPESGAETSWSDLGAALEAARKLIVQGGRIIVLSNLSATPGPGIEIIRNSRSAKAALKPLRQAAPPDVLAATQIASAADWASIYLLSRLDSQIVESLFMTPVESENEVARLLETCDGCVVLAGAQHVYSEIR